MKFFISVVLIACAALTAATAGTDSAPFRALMNGTSTISPTTTTTAPPVPNFQTVCSLPLGPVATPNRASASPSVMRGPAYAHKMWINGGRADVLFFTANEGEGGKNRVVVAVAADNCTVLWKFRADAEIVVDPMFDSETCVVQSFGQPGIATVWAINAATGALRWKNSFAASEPAAVTTAIHDGRVFFVRTSTANQQESGQVGYELVSWNAKSGQQEYSFSQCCVPMQQQQQVPVWFAANVLGSWAFFSVGSSIVAFEMPVAGQREWIVDLGRIGLGACSSGSAVMVRPLSGPPSSLPSPSSSSSSWTPRPKNLFLTCAKPNASAFDQLVALSQVNGSLLWTREVAGGVSLAGPVSLSKYTTEGCALGFDANGAGHQSTTVHCFDVIGDGGKAMWSTAVPTTAVPQVAYTDPGNFVLASTVGDKVFGLALMDPATGAVVRRFDVQQAKMANEIGAVGYPAVMENGWRLGFVAEGAASTAAESGTFAVVHRLN